MSTDEQITPMKSLKHILVIQSCILLAVASSLQAQQINGTPGSPGATVIIDGKQIPPTPMPFGGVIKESYLDSMSYWPPRVVPPKGAPNILLIMTDDQGYGVSSTFGCVISPSLCVQYTLVYRRLATTPELSLMRGSLMRASNRTPGAISWPGSAALPTVSDAASNDASSRVFVWLRAMLAPVPFS